MPTEITPWLDEAYPSTSKRDSIDPLVFSELPDSEQEILQTALEEGEYTEQMGNESGAFSSLRRTIEARATEDLTVYLRRGDAYYRVGLVEGDHIIAET